MAAVREVRVAVSVAESERGGRGVPSLLGGGEGLEGGFEEVGKEEDGEGESSVMVRQVPFTEMLSPSLASERMSGHEAIVRLVPEPPAVEGSWGVRVEITAGI